jgi:hypothetical protein
MPTKGRSLSKRIRETEKGKKHRKREAERRHAERKRGKRMRKELLDASTAIYDISSGA